MNSYVCSIFMGLHQTLLQDTKNNKSNIKVRNEMGEAKWANFIYLNNQRSKGGEINKPKIRIRITTITST